MNHWRLRFKRLDRQCLKIIAICNCMWTLQRKSICVRTACGSGRVCAPQPPARYRRRF